jgi:FKBP-type peptidyl-prolyl cis-trans isomerase
MKIAGYIVLFGLVVVFASSCLDNSPGETLTFEEQWIKDTTTIGVYVRSNNIQTIDDPSGVRLQIQTLGTGFPPKLSSSVSFSYTGMLLNGTQFDKGTTSGSVKDFVAGMQIAFTMLPEGSQARIFIPSGYGYGNTQVSDIPANSNLMFDVKLTSVVTTEIEKQQLGSDTTTIDNYLADKSIVAERDPSGLRYVITEQGSGAVPDLYSKVKLNYTGKLLANDFIFFSGTNGPSDNYYSRVVNYIYAFQVILPNMNVGSKVTLYVPSGLGFGDQTVSAGSSSIPANSNLIYELELVEIVD